MRESDMANSTLAKPLRVLHVGARPDIGRGYGGVDVAAWPLIAAQVAMGADVTVLVLGDQEPRAQEESDRIGVTLETVPAQRFEMLSREGAAAIKRIRPDVVHIHAVFIPAHAQLARILNRQGVPYVVSPHGGLNLWRGKVKKAVYGTLVEKPFFRRADTILVLTKRELQVVDGWLGPRGRSPQFLEVPNSLPPLPPGVRLWALPDRPRLVYLGRYDVIQKGLDRLVEIARLLPEVEVHAYGAASHTERRGFEALVRQGLPPNMAFHDTVRGEAKTEVFTAASIYVQPARHDGFPMSVVEAMRLGVPVAVADGANIAESVVRRDFGLALPDDPAGAAADLRAALAAPERLRRWSAAGRQWVVEELSPEFVAERTIRTYEIALGR
jgi:glycosyltransferase involved in cell wall biosynthesis